MSALQGGLYLGLGNDSRLHGQFYVQGSDLPFSKNYNKSAQKIFEHRADIKESVEKQAAGFSSCITQACQKINKTDYNYEDLCEAIRLLHVAALYETDLDKNLAKYTAYTSDEKKVEHEKTLSRTGTTEIFTCYQKDRQSSQSKIAELKRFKATMLEQLNLEKTHFFAIKEFNAASELLNKAIEDFNLKLSSKTLEPLVSEELQKHIDAYELSATAIKSLIPEDIDQRITEYRKSFSEAETSYHYNILYESIDLTLKASCQKQPPPYSIEAFETHIEGFKKSGAHLQGEDLAFHQEKVHNFEIYKNLLFYPVDELRELVLLHKENKHFKYYSVVYFQRLANENKYPETLTFFEDWQKSAFTDLSVHDFSSTLDYFSIAAKKENDSHFSSKMISAINTWIDHNASALEDPSCAATIFHKLGHLHLSIHNYDSSAITCYLENLRLDFSNPAWKEAVKNATFWITKKQRLEFLQKLPPEQREQMQQSMGHHAYESASSVYGLAASALRLGTNLVQEKKGDSTAVQTAQIVANLSTSSIVKRKLICSILKTFQGHDFKVQSDLAEDILSTILPSLLIAEPIVNTIIDKNTTTQEQNKKIKNIASQSFSMSRNFVLIGQDSRAIYSNLSQSKFSEVAGQCSLSAFSIISALFNTAISATMLIQPKFYTPTWQALHHITRSNTSGMVLKDLASVVSNSSSAIAYFSPGFFSKAVSATCKFSESIVGKSNLALVGGKCASGVKFLGGISGAIDVIMGIGFFFRLYNQYPEKRALYTIAKAHELIQDDKKDSASQLILGSKKARFILHDLLNDYEYFMHLMDDVKQFHFQDPARNYSHSIDRLLRSAKKDPIFSSLANIFSFYKLLYFLLKKDCETVNSLIQASQDDTDLIKQFEKVVIQSIFSRFNILEERNRIEFNTFISDVSRDVTFLHYDDLFKKLVKYLVLKRSAGAVGAAQETLESILTTITSLKAISQAYEFIPLLEKDLSINDTLLSIKGMKWPHAKSLFESPAISLQERARIKEDLCIHILETMIINQQTACDLALGIRTHLVSEEDSPFHLISNWLNRPFNFARSDPFNLVFLNQKLDLFTKLHHQAEKLDYKKFISLTRKKITAVRKDIDASLAQMLLKDKFETIEHVYGLVSNPRASILIDQSEDFSQLRQIVNTMHHLVSMDLGSESKHKIIQMMQCLDSTIQVKAQISDAKSQLHEVYALMLAAYGTNIICKLWDLNMTDDVLPFIDKTLPFVEKESNSKKLFTDLKKFLKK